LALPISNEGIKRIKSPSITSDPFICENGCVSARVRAQTGGGNREIPKKTRNKRHRASPES
jgi:hypothetical protein